jgi:hypothetical protein
MRKGLLKDYKFQLSTKPVIPSEDNLAERGIRKLEIKLKNSGTFRLELGVDALMNYILL